jgi:hypothetical protein
MVFKPQVFATLALSVLGAGLSPTPVRALDLEPVHDYPRLEVEFVRLISYFDYEKVRTLRIGQLMETVVNSEEFRRRVLAHKWNGKVQYADNDGLTNEEIYAKIREAIEHDNPDGRPHVMELVHRMGRPWFCSWRRAIGFTVFGSPVITTYFCKYHRMSDADLGGHFVHEWMHRIGFVHDFHRTAKRPYSVPYGVGRIAGEIMDELLGTQSALHPDVDQD